MKALLIIFTMTMTTQSFAAEPAKIGSPGSSSNVATSSGHEIQVGVKGMVCAFCAQGIEKRFKAQKEVESVEVSLANKRLKIKLKEGQSLSKEQITLILKDAGYDSDFGG